MKSIGICFGATTIQCVEISGSGTRVSVDRSVRVAHEGNPRKAFLEYLRGVNDLALVDRIAVTGRAFRSCVSLSSISEPEAVECALHGAYEDGRMPDAVISSGGETQLVYSVNRSGGIGAVLSGNKCASGTGEFFLQQIRRMGLTLDEAVALALTGTPHRIAGRCSVFCKSDCTHALNKGESKANIAAGLCLMMAEKIHELIKNQAFDTIALIGGGSLNTALFNHLKTRYPGIIVPPYASCFEAYGAALWAFNNKCQPLPQAIESVLKDRPDSFSRHRSLQDAAALVDFKTLIRGVPRSGDECILGLDVGSTTTKAVLMRKHDRDMVASVYLRTNGDPVRASRDCYREISSQIKDIPVSITGLGVTGSGRQIAALHALTDNVINEIIAHATAASWFDGEVDTIFEIGGQDAKYTYLTGGVASDYAMNEACSAGTGSFLEESARESLNVATEAIAELAIRGENPPNFTDQCAAFISSDIKTAGQESIGKENILAGLVYSICLNYLNRVKGPRPVGKKIFMQGGVCYNRAVPLAMASLMQTRIVVPPEPGLMGAFGVALEVANRIDRGLAAPQRFDLDELAGRDAVREGSFTCPGGREKCDRQCEVLRFRIAGNVYPFGGVCNRYYNLRLHREVDTDEFDLVELRQRLMFEEYGVAPVKNIATVSGGQDRPARTVGILRSFLTHSLYPLYSNFFDRLGFSILLSDAIDPDGVARIESAFCLPAEITHGSFYNLLSKKPDYIFLPQVAILPVPNVPTWSKSCVFVQGEPYYLRTTFRSEIEQSATVLLSPVLKMDASYDAAGDAIAAMAHSMGKAESAARGAWRFACGRQRAFERELLHQGEKVLAWLDANPDAFGIVLFGRPYSAFSDDAHKGIPHKTASRGYPVIPFDMLQAADVPVDEKMFWAMVQKIMKAATIVKGRQNLFGFYVTNFSCGPDSFLLGYFRRIMGTKPSLTLEVDQHTADAGIDTRVEAALDIMTSYRRIAATLPPERNTFRPARVVFDKGIAVVSSDGRQHALTAETVEVVIPNMGRYGTEALAAVFRGRGIRARALPVAGKDELLEGRRHATCKECLPYLVTSGSFMNYLKQRANNDTVTLLFLPTGGGPCRLGQYCKALSHTIEKERIPNTAVLAITDENGYAGLGAGALLKAWQAIVISDVLGDIRSMLSVAAEDRPSALLALETEWMVLLAYFEGRLGVPLSTLLTGMAKRLSIVPLKRNPSDVPVVSFVGEIFVRRDEFSRKTIVDYLEDRGFMVRVAPVAEYMCYSHYVVNSGLGERVFTAQEQVRMRLTSHIQEWWEWRIKSALARSGLYRYEMIEVEKTVEGIGHLVNVNFRGEAILTVGLAMREILNESCGVIAIGPFGCMPSRVAESILRKEMNVEGKKRLPGWEKKTGQFTDLGDLPFLSIETDGMPFPQIIEANLEAFVLQAKRVQAKLAARRAQHNDHRSFRHLPIVRFCEVVKRNAKRAIINITK